MTTSYSLVKLYFIRNIHTDFINIGESEESLMRKLGNSNFEIAHSYKEVSIYENKDYSDNGNNTLVHISAKGVINVTHTTT